MSSVSLLSVSSLAFADFKAAGTDYSKALASQEKWSEDAANAFVSMPNSFACIIANSGADANPNAEWTALIDEVACGLAEADPKSNATVYSKASVKSSRASNKSPQELTAWFNAQGGQRFVADVTLKQSAETLAPFGIKVYELTESCSHIMDKDKAGLKDMYADILNLGTIFGVEGRAEALVAGYKSELKNFKASLKSIEEGVRVFVYDSGEDAPFTAGRYAMPTALIEAAGGRNIMDDFNKSWGTVAWEEVVERDPQVVVIVNYGDVTAEQKRDYMMSNPAFKNISAVKNDRFVTLEYVEATAGPRNIKAVKNLADAFWTK